MGFEMLLNALMKMLGISKEEMHDKVAQGMEILEFTRSTAISLDERVTRIENNQALILDRLNQLIERQENSVH